MERQFISYPKSGRTWIRYILSRLGCDERVSFHHDRFEFNDGARPPHDFDLQARLARYPRGAKIVYLERDPRDVIVSLYHQVTGRFRDYFEYGGSISDFIRDPYFGVEPLRSFQAMWADILTQRDFLTVTYEECHRDTALTVGRILDYYGLAFPAAQIQAAIDASTFAQMKKAAEVATAEQPWLRPRNASPKTRRGQVGGFRTELSAEDVAFVNGAFGLD